MAWATPTITTTRGRHIRHTYIEAVGTLEGASAITVDLSNMPFAIYSGTVQGRVIGGTAVVVTLSIRAGIGTVGDVLIDNDIYLNALTVGTDPDYYPIQSIFESISAPSNANFMGAVTLPTNEIQLRLIAASANTDVVTVYIGLLSHILEV